MPFEASILLMVYMILIKNKNKNNKNNGRGRREERRQSAEWHMARKQVTSMTSRNRPFSPML